MTTEKSAPLPTDSFDDEVVTLADVEAELDAAETELAALDRDTRESDAADESEPGG